MILCCLSSHKGGVGLDWVWTSLPASLSLIFDSTNLDVPQCVDVTINDDILVEPTEDFAISLSLLTVNSFGQITLGTSFASVFIADNDINGKLLQTAHSINVTLKSYLRLLCTSMAYAGTNIVYTQYSNTQHTLPITNKYTSCSVGLCPNPVDILNGGVTFTGNSVGDTATYACNSGFELIGNALATCIQIDANSTAFSPAAPVCRREYRMNNSRMAVHR